MAKVSTPTSAQEPEDLAPRSSTETHCDQAVVCGGVLGDVIPHPILYAGYRLLCEASGRTPLISIYRCQGKGSDQPVWVKHPARASEGLS